MIRATRVVFILSWGLMMPALLPGADLPKEVVEKMDAIVAAAYQAASAKLPCKISVIRKTHMMRWQDVDKCLSNSVMSVDLDKMKQQLADLRPPYVSEGDFAAAVDAALTRQALPYGRLFLVKSAGALLPLTNPILKYLSPDCLKDLPVFDQSRKQIGVFAGTFTYEGTSTLGGRTYQLTLFQYTDLQGKLQAPPERLLLDYYGVPWEKVMELRGFRLLMETPSGTGNDHGADSCARFQLCDSLANWQAR